MLPPAVVPFSAPPALGPDITQARSGHAVEPVTSASLLPPPAVPQQPQQALLLPPSTLPQQQLQQPQQGQQFVFPHTSLVPVLPANASVNASGGVSINRPIELKVPSGFKPPAEIQRSKSDTYLEKGVSLATSMLSLEQAKFDRNNDTIGYLLNSNAELKADVAVLKYALEELRKELVSIKTSCALQKSGFFSQW